MKKLDAFDLAVAQATGKVYTNPKRVGNFTSSEIGALTGNGKSKGALSVPALTYVRKKNYERRLGRALSEEIDARPLTWGKVCERYVLNNLLTEEYIACTNVTLEHPEFDCWAGSPDFVKNNCVTDLKCPKTLLSFCDMVDAFEGGLTESDQIGRFIKLGKQYENYYWQLVSNAILTQSESAELMVFCPYQSELDFIRGIASSVLGLGNTTWISFASDDELPHIPEGGYYKNLYKFEFKVPVEDKELLTEKVNQAQDQLIKRL